MRKLFAISILAAGLALSGCAGFGGFARGSDGAAVFGAPSSARFPVWIDPATGRYTLEAPAPITTTANPSLHVPPPAGEVPGGGGAQLLGSVLPAPFGWIVSAVGGAACTALAVRKRSQLIGIAVQALAHSPEARRIMRDAARAAGLSPLLESFVAGSGVVNRNAESEGEGGAGGSAISPR